MRSSILAAILLAAACVLMAACQESKAVMPDPAVTPGATNPAVTQANLRRTVCRSGWTKTIRPPASYTNKLKRQQLASGPYASREKPAAFEEDHLISLELGGHPKDPRNLWPEPYKPKDGLGARVKDQVEDYLKREVCAGRSTLAQAHEAILEWEATYHERLEGRRR